MLVRPLPWHSFFRFQEGNNIFRHFKSGESSMKKNAGPCGPATGGNQFPPPLTIGRGGLVNSRLLFTLAAVISNHEADPAPHKHDHHRNGYQTEDYGVIPIH